MKEKKNIILVFASIACIFAVGGLGLWGKAALEERNSEYLRRDEVHTVRQLLLGLRSYASDHNGKFPPRLSDLYPDYIDLRQLFSVREPASSIQNPYRYFPGHTDTGKSNTPLIISPNVYKPGAKTIVGFLGGHAEEVPITDPRIKSHFPAN